MFQNKTEKKYLVAKHNDEVIIIRERDDALARLQYVRA
jgi:hypothetical protein